MGGTLFDLNALQDEYRREPGSVVELDFYHAGALLPLSDEAIRQRALFTYLPPCSSVSPPPLLPWLAPYASPPAPTLLCLPAPSHPHQLALTPHQSFSGCRVEDSSILRFRAAVTAFSPGSRQHLPEVRSLTPAGG